MSIPAIAIWIVIILAGLAVLGILGFGARGLAYGKVQPMSLLMGLTPIVVLVVLGFVMETWAQAAIWATIIMFCVAAAALFLTGMRGLFG